MHIYNTAKSFKLFKIYAKIFYKDLFMREKMGYILIMILAGILFYSCPIPPSPPPAPSNFEPRAYSNEGLNVDFDLTTSGRWIPNNGTDLRSFTIKMWYADNSYTSGGKQNLEYAKPDGFKEDINLNNIMILSPWDPNQENNELEENNSNIYKNKGYGFKLGVSNSIMYEPINLATFYLIDDDKFDKYKTSYRIEYNEYYFESNGKPKPGYYLKTDNNYFLYLHSDKSDYDYYFFHIQTLNSPVRPGDDLELRFACVEAPNLLIAQAMPEKTIAVYDKLLVDEAKRYCNNKEEIFAWTAWHPFAPEEIVEGAVAYSKGCADSIEHFNMDLECQRNTISFYYHEYNFEPIGDNPDPDLHREWFGWSYTYAPPNSSNSEWNNYLKGVYNSTTTKYDSLKITVNPQGVKNTYYPFSPGFSSWRVDNGGYRSYDTGYSAGVDCGGLIQRVADYSDNMYALPSCNDTTAPDGENGRLQWGKTTPNLKGPYTSGLASTSYSWEIPDKNLIVPGDLLIFPPDPPDGNHVAMITDIGYEKDLYNPGRIIDKAQVFVIEATSYRNEWQVINYNTWNFLDNDIYGKGTYMPYRLRQ